MALLASLFPFNNLFLSFLWIPFQLGLMKTLEEVGGLLATCHWHMWIVDLARTGRRWNSLVAGPRYKVGSTLPHWDPKIPTWLSMEAFFWLLW